MEELADLINNELNDMDGEVIAKFIFNNFKSISETVENHVVPDGLTEAQLEILDEEYADA